MVQRDIGVLQADLRHHVFPKLEGFQYVRFVDAGDAFAAFACRLESHVRNAFDFWARIAHGVESFFAAREMSVSGHATTAWLAKVNVTRQFSDDQDVKA